MISFLTLAVKAQLNVHDLNNEAVAGNVTDIRIMDFLDEEGRRIEAPAVSGRMLKHWHFDAMNNLIMRGTYSSIPLCDGCKAKEPIRPGELKDNKLVQVAKPESEAIKSCVVCDIHGFLIAQSAQDKTKGVSSRRTSRIMFSWLMPVLGTETTYKQVVHTRVSQQQEMAEGEGAAQMIFNKSYASGIYAFVSALDIERIGLKDLSLGEDNPYAVPEDKRKERIKVAIEALQLMLSGQLGASLSHALPHQNPIEILVTYSEKGPLPFPVSPMYTDFLNKTIGLMPKDSVFLYWGNSSHEKIKKMNSINEIFAELMNKVEK
ncbi:MAG: DevR family CRISPR-associated autoregulator [Candidatus Aminicenantes bacterium]|nr:DevR family CRISPR-associated autoregulator [Candidatus Aminicenantes bacterium]